jgi:hypothetical protein
MQKSKKPPGPPPEDMDEPDHMLAPIPEHHQANKRRTDAAYKAGIIRGVDCQYVHRLIYAGATTDFVDHFITHTANFYAILKKSRKTQ